VKQSRTLMERHISEGAERLIEGLEKAWSLGRRRRRLLIVVVRCTAAH